MGVVLFGAILHFFNSTIFNVILIMDTEIIFLVEESNEGGYQARALGESIFTEAENLEELKKNVKEAVITHYEEGNHPRIVRLHFVKEELLSI